MTSGWLNKEIAAAQEKFPVGSTVYLAQLKDPENLKSGMVRGTVLSDTPVGSFGPVFRIQPEDQRVVTPMWVQVESMFDTEKEAAQVFLRRFMASIKHTEQALEETREEVKELENTLARQYQELAIFLRED